VLSIALCRQEHDGLSFTDAHGIALVGELPDMCGCTSNSDSIGYV
jgi:hypothetical protein